MPRNPRERRERLFKQGSRAWAGVTGDSHGAYVCPLCGVGYTELSLTLDPPLLSLEDVPPKAVGGRPLVLTCRECNSRAGHTVDAALYRPARRREGYMPLSSNDPALCQGRAESQLMGLKRTSTLKWGPTEPRLLSRLRLAFHMIGPADLRC